MKKIITFIWGILILSVNVSGKEYADKITINCGRIKMQLSKHTYWNINKLWYEKHYIGDSSGYWGTVFAIPGTGLIGSGHLSKQGEGEELKSLELVADGKYVSPEVAKTAIVCKEFSLKKSARVKNIIFDYTLNVKNNKLYESCKLRAVKDQRLALMYNFMHPWNKNLTDYYVLVNEAEAKDGTLKADDRFPYDGPAQWITLYDMVNNIGIVSKYSGDPAVIRLWDRRGNKKIYLQALKNKTMKAGKIYSYNMETDFYHASPSNWKEKAGSIIGSKVVSTVAVHEPEDKEKNKPGRVSFPEFRKRAAKLTPFSPEDYALGRELIKAVRELAKKRKPLFERPFLFSRSQPYRSGRLYFCRYLWTDRPLFSSRMLWEPDRYDYKDISFKKTLELFRDYDLDGYSSFIFSYERTMKKIYKAAADLKLDPAKFHILLGIVPSITGYKKIDNGSLNLFFNNPYSFRYKDVNVAASYVTDRNSPEKLKEYLDLLEKRGGREKKVMLITQIIYGHIRDGWRAKSLADPYDLYVKKGAVPATLLLHHLDYLSKYLRVSGGLDLGCIYNTSDLKIDVDYYNNYGIPLYAAAIAQEEFNGKKILANRFEVGYTSFHGSQTISRDGTKTLRNFLDIGIKNNLDIMIGTEWDELNEDTNIEPTVAKPMAAQRIIKYYMSKVKKQVPTPNPGDDLSLPNMIISQRRQLAYGWAMDVELLNIPDTDKGKPYSVTLELLDQDGRVVFESKAVTFNTAKLKDHTFKFPSQKFASCQLLQPRLTIDYKGGKRIVSEGLPFTVMRTTACWDHTYFNTPLRNILFADSSDIKFRETGKSLAPGVKQVTLDVSLKFKDKLNTVEVVQDSHEIYAYDPKDEYLQNDPDRILYKLSSSYINSPEQIYIKIKKQISNAPSALTFNIPRDPVNKTFENPTVKAEPLKAFAEENGRIKVSMWGGDDIISIKKEDIDKAVLTISGIRDSGQNKGSKFEWKIPLKDVGEYGVKSKVFEDGLCFALQVQYRPTVVPLPLDCNNVKFKTVLAADEPNGVLALRAVGNSGKVYWSKGFAVNNKVAADKVRIQVYSEDRGPVCLDVAKNRVPDIKYEFTPRYGNILATDAGREFYAHAGGYLSTAIDFKGLINSKYSIPQCYPKYHKPGGINRSAPIWEKQEDGKWALRFDGKYGNFLALPNTAVPHRSGFTMTFELKPERLKPEQIIFAQYGVYLTGFRLSVVNGKFNIEFKRWTPFDRNTRISLAEFKSQVPLYAGKWQKVVFKYDEKQVSISANGKTESFPCQGISQWLTVSSFGGSGRLGKSKEPLYYNGLLRYLEIKHTASED